MIFLLIFQLFGEKMGNIGTGLLKVLLLLGLCESVHENGSMTCVSEVSFIDVMQIKEYHRHFYSF